MACARALLACFAHGLRRLVELVELPRRRARAFGVVHVELDREGVVQRGNLGHRARSYARSVDPRASRDADQGLTAVSRRVLVVLQVVLVVVLRDLLGGVGVVDEVHRVSEHPLTSFEMSDTKGEGCTDLGDANLLDAVDAGLGARRSSSQLVQVDDEHVALVHAAGKQEPANEDSLRSARSKLLDRLVGERPPEVHLLAECEVVLVGPWLTTAPVPRGHAVRVPADVEPMAERSRSIRPPPVRETGLAQQTANTVADDAHSPFDDAVGLGAVRCRAEMDGRTEVDRRLLQLLRAVGEEVGPCHGPSELLDGGEHAGGALVVGREDVADV